jgi:hypothetical protein
LLLAFVGSPAKVGAARPIAITTAKIRATMVLVVFSFHRELIVNSVSEKRFPKQDKEKLELTLTRMTSEFSR